MELGKTTLAKKLFRHVRHQFECSGMVYVSQQPRVGEILHDIGKQVGKENLEGNLRSLLKIKRDVSGSTIKILSALSPVPKALEVLKLRFFKNTSEQINLSSHPNIVELGLFGFSAMLLNIEAFPPNLVKLNLVGLMVVGHLLAVLKKLTKLRKTLLRCRHDAEKMDLSGDSFPQLEVLHIEDAHGLSEVTCMDDMSIPKLKKLLLVQGPIISPISLRVSERLAKLRI
ncbi:hypothetical protein KY289_037412 [Solanum tuberosum]|nr:hypothetical protein KY289_037412 [Solanum tuberosum]